MAEILELERAGRESRLVMNPMNVTLSGYLAAGTVMIIVQNSYPSVWALHAGIAVPLFAWVLWCAVHGWVDRRKITQDARLGVVRRIEDAGTLVEVLPESGMVWTVDGEVAHWRYATKPSH